MTVASRKTALTPAGRRLVELMQATNFGRIEDLAVRGGSPVLDPLPRVVREVKFGAENGPRAEASKRDFPLKTQVMGLFAEMQAIGDGVIRSLEIRHGLPFRMTMEERTA